MGKTEETTSAVRPIVVGPDGRGYLEYTGAELRFFQTHQATSQMLAKDEDESRRVGRAVGASAKQCWFNARRTVLKLEEYAEASYVEGWAVLRNGMCIEHGWVLQDGVVIDPTLPDRVAAYFPGLEFRGRGEIRDFLATPQGKDCRGTPFFFAYGWGGWESPTMRKAQEDATAFVQDRIAAGATTHKPSDVVAR